jgi:hypothetical protein
LVGDGNLKILTHVVFGAGAVVALLPGVPLDLRYLLAMASSLLVNLIIDGSGTQRMETSWPGRP